MKKKFLTFVITAFSIIAMTMNIAMASELRVQLDGEYVEIDPAPIIVDGRTLLPARAIVEMLGGDVGWDNDLRQVHIYHGDTHVLLTIGSPIAYINGNAVPLDVPPQIIDDRTKIPLRFVAESLGVEVDFAYGTIYIISQQVAIDTSNLVTGIDFVLHDENVITVLFTPVVRRNAEAEVFFYGEPETEWHLSIRYATGYGLAAGLGEQMADETGYVVWRWRIGANTTIGDWPVTITGNGHHMTFYISVVE